MSMWIAVQYTVSQSMENEARLKKMSGQISKLSESQHRLLPIAAHTVGFTKWDICQMVKKRRKTAFLDCTSFSPFCVTSKAKFSRLNIESIQDRLRRRGRALSLVVMLRLFGAVQTLNHHGATLEDKELQ